MMTTTTTTMTTTTTTMPAAVSSRRSVAARLPVSRVSRVADDVDADLLRRLAMSARADADVDFDDDDIRLAIANSLHTITRRQAHAPTVLSPAVTKIVMIQFDGVVGLTKVNVQARDVQGDGNKKKIFFFV